MIRDTAKAVLIILAWLLLLAQIDDLDARMTEQEHAAQKQF